MSEAWIWWCPRSFFFFLTENITFAGLFNNFRVSFCSCPVFIFHHHNQAGSDGKIQSKSRRLPSPCIYIFKGSLASYFIYTNFSLIKAADWSHQRSTDPALTQWGTWCPEAPLDLRGRGVSPLAPGLRRTWTCCCNLWGNIVESGFVKYQTENSDVKVNISVPPN